MKKAVSLILALLMTLSLCACGASPSGSQGSQSDSPEEVIDPNALHLNETKTIGDYEFTVTGVEFTACLKLSGTSYSAGEGNVYLLLYFSIRNVGKVEHTPHLSCAAEYADGYLFEGGAFLSTMSPLSDAVNMVASMEVPAAVQEDLSSPLKITVKGSSFGVEEDYAYSLNPMDSLQRQAVYEKAEFLLQNGYYAAAQDSFKRCGDYQDSAAMASAAAEAIAVTEDPGACKEKLGDYRVVTGEELSALLTGNRFLMTRTADAWTFLDGGTLYDTWCNGNPFLSKYVKWGYGDFQPTWSVQEDKLIITGLNENGNQESASYTVYEYTDGIYLLSTDSTAKFVPDQYFTDGSGVYCLYRQIEEDVRYLPRA